MAQRMLNRYGSIAIIVIDIDDHRRLPDFVCITVIVVIIVITRGIVLGSRQPDIIAVGRIGRIVPTIGAATCNVINRAVAEAGQVCP